MFALLPRLATALLCLSVGACGLDESPEASPPRTAGATTHTDGSLGFTVSVPAGWHRTRESLTPALTDPREIVALGTLPLGHRRSNCEAFAGSAREDLGADSGCGDRGGASTYWIPFTDGGRHFYALVVIGPVAPERLRRQAFSVLDSLRFDPAVQPDWPSSG